MDHSDRPCLASTETPCVGICSTIYGDYVCRGCFRSTQEVIDWNAYQDPEKLLILTRLNAQITQVMRAKICIVDTTLLKAKCQHYQIKIRADFTPYAWAHALLRAGAHEIKDITKYGISIRPEFSHLSFAKLIEHIDDELFSMHLASREK
jgi:predicted Fe-S protein YdhL (DUF1289 family)